MVTIDAIQDVHSGRAWRRFASALALIAVAGCGGSSVEVGIPPDLSGPEVVGQVSMPNGEVAALPSMLERVASALSGRVDALDPVDDNIFPVGAGVEVRLVQLNASNIVNGEIRGGRVLFTAVTDSIGQYAVRLIAGSTADTCRFMLEVGSGSTLTRAFVTAVKPERTNVNFESEATVRLLLAQIGEGNTTLCELSAADIRLVNNAVVSSNGEVFGDSAAAVNASAEVAAAADPGVQNAIAVAIGASTPIPTNTNTAPPTTTATATATAPPPTATGGAATATRTATRADRTATHTPTNTTGVATRTATVGFSPTNTVSVPTATSTTAIDTATPTNTLPPTATSTSTVAEATATQTQTTTTTPVATDTASPTSTGVAATATATAPSTSTATAIPTGTATATLTVTPAATSTNTAVAAATATNTVAAPATPTNTALPPAATATNTAVSAATATNTSVPAATATNTVVPAATATNTVVPAATATNTVGAAATATNTVPAAATATNTVVPAATATNTTVPAATATNTVVPASTATNTVPAPTATSTASATATRTFTGTPTSTASASATRTATRTSTTVPTATVTPLPPCPISAGRYTLTQVAGGQLQVASIDGGTPGGFPFPTGGMVVQDVSVGTQPACVHEAVIPASGGFSAPIFCIPGLNFSVQVTQNGCGVGRIDSNGGSDYTVTEVGDTSDNSATCSLPAVGCPPGPPSTMAANRDSSVRVDITVGNGAADTCGGGGTANAIAIIPVQTQTWLADDFSCPDADGVFDPADTDILFINQHLDFTTDVSTSTWSDIDGDGCSIAGAGPAAGFSRTGVCLNIAAQTITTVATGTIGSDGSPLFDLTFATRLPNTISGPAASGGATCGTPPVVNFAGSATRCIE